MKLRIALYAVLLALAVNSLALWQVDHWLSGSPQVAVTRLAAK